MLHAKTMRAIELLGTEVAPIVRRETVERTDPQRVSSLITNIAPAS